DKQQNNNFQRGGQFHPKRNLYKAGYNEQKQRQAAQKNILIISVQQLQNHHDNHQGPDYHIHQKRTSVLPQFQPHSLRKRTPFFLLSFAVCHFSLLFPDAGSKRKQFHPIMKQAGFQVCPLFSAKPSKKADPAISVSAFWLTLVI